MSINERNELVLEYLWCIDCVIRQNYGLVQAAHLDRDDVYQNLAMRRSLMSIAETLRTDYHIEVSHTVVAGELSKMGYSKQLNQKMLQVGQAHPDREAQFEYINQTAKEYLAEGVPVREKFWIMISP